MLDNGLEKTPAFGVSNRFLPKRPQRNTGFLVFGDLIVISYLLKLQYLVIEKGMWCTLSWTVYLQYGFTVWL